MRLSVAMAMTKSSSNHLSTQGEPVASINLEGALLLMLGASLGALLAVLVLPDWFPGLLASLSGPRPKAYWYLARSSGLVAYILLWLSVALGLGVTNKLARLWPGGLAAVDLHQFAGLLGLAFALFHGLILLGDHYIGFSLVDILLPFATTGYRPLWVGLGQLGFYLALPVAFSFYVRRTIGYRAWRLLHYASFAIYWLTTLHGLGAGTDTAAPAMVAIYGLTGLATYYLTVFRILSSPSSARLNARKQARGTREPTGNHRSPD